MRVSIYSGKNVAAAATTPIESTALITSDPVVLGILIVILGLVLASERSQHIAWRRFYSVVPALLLCYFIPGPNAATELGRRRPNWVGYVNVPAGPRLDRLLTDRNGELARRGTSAMPPPAEGRAGCTARLAGS